MTIRSACQLYCFIWNFKMSRWRHMAISWIRHLGFLDFSKASETVHICSKIIKAAKKLLKWYKREKLLTKHINLPTKKEGGSCFSTFQHRHIRANCKLYVRVRLLTQTDFCSNAVTNCLKGVELSRENTLRFISSNLIQLRQIKILADPDDVNKFRRKWICM